MKSICYYLLLLLGEETFVELGLVNPGIRFSITFPIRTTYKEQVGICLENATQTKPYQKMVKLNCRTC